MAPSGILASDSTGILYGTTRGGGTNHAGTIFRVNSDGSSPDLLFQFSGSGAEQGRSPTAPLLLGSDDALYDTTTFGWPSGVGTIFKVNKDGSGYRVLHGLTGRSFGRNQQHALIEGRDGMLYGTTELGGAYYEGSTFKINKDGSGFSTLRDFGGDGENTSRPAAELMEGSDGALYGATAVGGSNGFSGLVFKLNKDGSGYTVLHSFDLNSNDGSNPKAALIEGSGRRLGRTTVEGGVHNSGTGFQTGQGR